MKTSKIIDLSKHEFEWKFWKARDFKIKFENWDEWKLVKKDENALKIWDELTYEIQEWEYWNQIKLQKAQYNKSDQWKARIIVGAMQSTIQLLSYKWKLERDDIEKTFDWFYSVMSKKNGN